MKAFYVLFALCFIGVSQAAKRPSKYVVSTEKATFFEAYAKCKENNMVPAEIYSEKDEFDVEALLPQITQETVTDYHYWIFATNLGDKKNYKWLDSGKPLLYSNYNDGEPNNLYNRENCLEIVSESELEYRWNDLPCDTKLHYICKYR